MTTIQESKIQVISNYLKIEPQIFEEDINSYTVIYVIDEISSQQLGHLIRFNVLFHIEPLDQERFQIVIEL
jgi:hypothetical protein